MALIQSEDRAIQRQFRDLLQLAKIFQVNDAEATRWLGVTVNGGLVMEPRKMVEQMMVAVPQTGRGSRKVVSIITLGGSGAAVIGSWRKADAFFQPATTELESRIIDQTGAGDALQAGFIRTVVEMRFSPLALRLAIRVGADMAGRIIRVAGGAADSGMTTNKLVRSTAKWEASIRASHPELIE
jgi:sugar/nucleoside kinase (ribokinase family)